MYVVVRGGGGLIRSISYCVTLRHWVLLQVNKAIYLTTSALHSLNPRTPYWSVATDAILVSRLNTDDDHIDRGVVVK